MIKIFANYKLIITFFARICFFSFFLLLFHSCQTVVELELPDKDPSLVLNCFFNPDSVFTAEISKSQYVLDNASIKRVNEAKVTLFEGSVWIEDLVNVSDGYYRSSNYIPLVGKNYSLVVEAPGYKTVNAQDFIPATTRILGVDTGSFFFESQQFFEMKIRFKDPPEEENFYQLQLFTKNYFQNFDSAGNVFFDTTGYNQSLGFESHDLVFDDINWFGPSGAVFSDELFSKKGEYTVSVLTYLYGNPMDSLSKGYSADEVKISLKSVSESYYKYVRSYLKYQQSHDNPFAEPVQVYNNINNGYGIFAGFSATSYIMKF